MSTEDYIYEVYDYLHSVPETGGNEIKTSSFIAKELKTMGYTVRTGIAETGVVGVLISENAGPSIVLRADMDAIEYLIDGKRENRHTCGHDANASMMLATAKAISETGIGCGQLMFLFQPDEENGMGAKKIVESKILNEIDEMYGIHLRPIQEARLGEATPALCHGASSKMDVSLLGKASHGARPHLGVNAIDAAALVINAINALRVDPRVPHSAKVTKINSIEGAHNVIPSEVKLTLDIRCQTNEVMIELISKIEKAICGACDSIGATANINDVKGLPASEYNETAVAFVHEAIVEVLGSALPPIVTPGGEDFHVYARALNIKTAYVGLGADLVPGLHDPEVTFKRDALVSGMEIMKSIVKKRLT